MIYYICTFNRMRNDKMIPIHMAPPLSRLHILVGWIVSKRRWRTRTPSAPPSRSAIFVQHYLSLQPAPNQLPTRPAHCRSIACVLKWDVGAISGKKVGSPLQLDDEQGPSRVMTLYLQEGAFT